MEKKSLLPCLNSARFITLHKTLLVMKLTTILLIAICLQASANGNAQRVSISQQNTSLEKVFKEIHRKTGYQFFYQDELLRKAQHFDINVKNASIEEVLELCFKNQPLNFTITEKTITIEPKQVPREMNAPPPVQVEVRGMVKDENGNPLAGVSIAIVGKSGGTTTDEKGNFSIQVADNNTVLRFSYVGYKTVSIALKGRTSVEVQMEPELSSMNNIVVVGYGTQRKRDVTGAISSIAGEDLVKTPAPNVLELAQGKLAGVDIVKSDGSPGAGMQIRIRGNRSINASNEPLYVVDGIPTNTSISNFNPNDIESMEVLKDASAVAIYGSRGANGVVLITTKKGRQGKTVISYNGYYGTKKPIEHLDFMNGNQFAAYERVAHNLSADDNSKDSSFLSETEIDNLNKGISTNWLDLVLKNGNQQEHNISASGGSSNLTYYLSGSYYNENGTIPKTDFTRYTFRVNLDARLNDRLSVGVNSTVATSLRNQMINAPFARATKLSPLVTPYDDEGNLIEEPESERLNSYYNPLLYFQPDKYVNEIKGYRVFANIYAKYAITDHLTYRLNYGPDYSSSRQGIFNGSLAGSTNSASISNGTDFDYTLENILTYDKRFTNHYLNVVGLFSTQKSRSESSGSSGMDIPLESSTFHGLRDAATITNLNGSLSEWGLLSYMGRVNYHYKDKYLVTVSGRADGSSRLAKGNKWAFFPAVALGWIVSKEQFLNVPAISLLKLRAGYGEVGNTSIAPYQTFGGLARTVYAFGDNEAFGFGQDVIPNPDLKWEVSKTVNLGLDFGLINNRITGSLEFYDTHTSDLLLRRFIPITSGYSSILQNIGSTRNRGFELTLSSNIIKSNGSGLDWDIDLNVFSNKEEIVQLFNKENDDVGNQWFIGEPINVFYSYKQAGIWQDADAGHKPGDINIADVNGRNAEGELTKQPDGMINSDDRTVLGSTVPKWSGGITNRFSYKGFDLSVFVYARQGQLLRSDFHFLGDNNWQGMYNALNLNYWTADNPTGTYPKPNAGKAPLYSEALTYFDGSFVKIKNISFGYNFQNKLISRMGLSSLRLYTTINNAITFSKFDVVDPETSDGRLGVSNPLTSATYILGINLKF